MTLFNKLLSVALVGSVIFIAIAWKYWPSASTQISAAQKSISTTGNTDARASSKSQLASNLQPKVRSLDQPQTPAAKLARLYETSTDKRALYDLALSQPENGGFFIASRIRMECMAWVSQQKTNALWLKTRLGNIPAGYPQREKIEQALRRMHEPCLGFDTSPVNYDAFSRTTTNSSLDPVDNGLKNLSAAFSAADPSTAVQAVLADIARSENAHAMYEAMVTLGAANSPSMVILVDGQVITPGYWDAFAAALPAAACQLGVDCTGNAPGLTNQCARGKCYDDLNEYAKALLNPAQFEEYILLRDLTSVAIATRDFSRFTVLRKPK